MNDVFEIKYMKKTHERLVDINKGGNGLLKDTHMRKLSWVEDLRKMMA